MVVDPFGEIFYLQPDEDDRDFYYRDHTATPNCEMGVDCLAVEFADFNNDGDFDDEDLDIWDAQFGRSPNGALEHGDAQGDLDVDGDDFLSWQRKYGTGISSQAASQGVPEPGRAACRGHDRCSATAA